MMSVQMAASLRVIVVLVCVTAGAALADAAAGGVRVGLTRIHSEPGVTASQFVRDALRRDMHRRARFGRSSRRRRRRLLRRARCPRRRGRTCPTAGSTS